MIKKLAHALATFLFPHAQWFLRELSFSFLLETRSKTHSVYQHLLEGMPCTAARCVLTDRKAIGLNLLKIECEVNIKYSQLERIYGNFCDVFNHQVVPVSRANPQAVELIDIMEKTCHQAG